MPDEPAVMLSPQQTTPGIYSATVCISFSYSAFIASTPSCRAAVCCSCCCEYTSMSCASCSSVFLCTESIAIASPARITTMSTARMMFRIVFFL